MTPKLETLETIKARCTTEGDCWIWPARAKRNGKTEAPVCRHGGKVVKVRRLVRELADGKPVPSKLDVPSRCGNRLCVSPKCSLKVSIKRSRQMQIERGHLNDPASIAKRAATRRATSRFSEADIEQVRTSTESCAKAGAAVGMTKAYAHAVRTGLWRSTANNPFAGLMA